MFADDISCLDLRFDQRTGGRTDGRTDLISSLTVVAGREASPSGSKSSSWSIRGQGPCRKGAGNRTQKIWDQPILSVNN